MISKAEFAGKYIDSAVGYFNIPFQELTQKDEAVEWVKNAARISECNLSTVLAKLVLTDFDDEKEEVIRANYTHEDLIKCLAIKKSNIENICLSDNGEEFNSWSYTKYTFFGGDYLIEDNDRWICKDEDINDEGERVH